MQNLVIHADQESNNVTITKPDDGIIDTASTMTLFSAEDIIKKGQTDEQHKERVRIGHVVEKLTHLHCEDELDRRRLIFPSIPVSYDENGMVQAEASSSVPKMPVAATTNNGIAMEHNGATVNELSTSNAAIGNNEPDYPQFIRVLYQKDSNGQTLASKLVNLALLAVSFGYVLFSVFNIDKGMTRGWTPAEIGMRIPLDTWASYENSLSEKPVATKTIINVVIYLLGDWLSQTIFKRNNILDFDAGRTLKNGFVGMCFGPAVHEYYEFSDWILPVDGVTMGITNRAFKILMDQTIYLAVKCSIYIMAIGVLNGESVENSAENVKNRLKPIMFTAWKFWPLVHCVTYGLIPARHRILWVNSVDLVWNAILASKARDDNYDAREEGEDSKREGVKLLEGTEREDITNLANQARSKSVHFSPVSLGHVLSKSSNLLSEPTLTGQGEGDTERDKNALEAHWEDSEGVKVVATVGTSAAVKKE